MTDKLMILREIKDVRKAAAQLMNRADKLIKSLQLNPEEESSEKIERALEKRRQKFLKRTS
jgi:hypothetical protein